MPPPNQNLLEPIELSINMRRLANILLIGCIGAEIAFVLLDYHVNFKESTDIRALQRMFNITREDGLASWFASTQTFLVGMSLGFIYLCVKHHPNKQREKLGWLVLALFFVYMAIDDGAMIHERLGTAFRKSFTQSGISVDYYPSYTWQLIFMPVYAAFGLFTITFLWIQLKEKLSKILLIVSFLCFGLAFSLDFIEGLEPDHPWNIFMWIAENTEMNDWALDRYNENAYETLRHFSQSFEESIEMFAFTLLWYVVLCHVPTVASSSIRLHFSK